jgi:hypothetical protein
VLDLRLGLDDCTAICPAAEQASRPIQSFTADTGVLLRMSFGRMLRSSASPQIRSGSWRPWSRMLPRAWPRRAVGQERRSAP